jgi:hypothetical protein
LTLIPIKFHLVHFISLYQLRDTEVLSVSLSDCCAACSCSSGRSVCVNPWDWVRTLSRTTDRAQGTAGAGCLRAAWDLGKYVLHSCFLHTNSTDAPHNRSAIPCSQTSLHSVVCWQFLFHLLKNRVSALTYQLLGALGGKLSFIRYRAQCLYFINYP